MGTVSVRLLGPFAVTVDGSPVALSSRLRTLLAVLALDADRSVTTERIAAAVWGQDRPAGTRKAIQVLVTRLRTVLGARVVGTTANGYRLDVPPGTVDLHRFESALAASRATEDAAEEYRLVREALVHWRGLPFEAVDSDLLVTVDRPRLLQSALESVERCADLALVGHASDLGELAAMLRELVGIHPLRESLWVRLMAVLDRTGRRTDALAAYQDLYRILREDLGTPPGDEAQAMHQRLLADGTGTDPGTGRSPTPGTNTTGPPSMLPPSDAALSGRADTLASLDGLLAYAGALGAARIAVVDGPGGIGKTTTVLHWAHRVAGRFPDGNLYVNLRGFSPANAPLVPEAAIRRLLDMLGVPPGRIPADADAQAALYRSVLADRRLLLVLDNARDVEQVRPLLPGGQHCVAVVTSRNRLGGLVAMEGAARLTLRTLTPSESHEVLATRLGTARLTAEPEAASELLALCGGLPLAHVIVAEHVAGRPGARLADLVRELHQHDSRIDALSAEPADEHRTARSVFSWSYRALACDAARVFRLLGLHPGPHITVPGVASLAALPERRARAAIAELERASLLIELAPGRFTMHELLMDYAIELVADAPRVDTDAATVRMFDHYLQVAHQAEEALAPTDDRHTVGTPSDGVLGTLPPADFAGGIAVFDNEAPVLVAMVRRAAATGNHEHAWRIARCIRGYLWGRVQMSAVLEVERMALAALKALGDVQEQVTSRRWIGYALMRLGRLDDAWRTIEPTLALAERLADDSASAWVLHAMSTVLGERGRPGEALDHARRALDLFHRAGDRVAVGRTEPNVALYLRRLDKLDDALDVARHALTVQTETGDHSIRGYTHELIGDIHRDRGDHRASVEAFRAGVDHQRSIGRTLGLAQVLDKLGDAYEALGDPDRGSIARQDARFARDEAGPLSSTGHG